MLIEIGGSDRALRSWDGQVLMLALANLIPRIGERYIAIRVAVPSDIECLVPGYTGTGGLASNTLELLQSINPAGLYKVVKPRRSAGEAVELRATVGDTDWLLYGKGCGWSGFVSDSPGDLPPSESSLNPVGPTGAAALLASELYKFAEGLSYSPQRYIRFSFYGGRSLSQPELDLPSDINLGKLAQVGAGALGNALVWILGRMSRLRGSMMILDPETVELTNNNRYLLLTQALASSGVSKVAVAQQSLRHQTELQVDAVRKDFDSQSVNHADMVLALVDDAEVRVAVQRTWPAVLINGGTDVQYVTASVHTACSVGSGNDACLGCLLPAGYKKPDRSAREATVSFVSCFAGALVAAQVLRYAVGPTTLQPCSGYFNVFCPDSGRWFKSEAIAGCATCSSRRVSRLFKACS